MSKPLTALHHQLRTKDTRLVYYILVFAFDFLIGLVATAYSLFLLSKGLDVFQVSLVNTVFMISSVLFEIPTGVYADYAGRKKSVLLSFACLPIGFGIYFLASNTWWFAVAEICTAFSVACLSGALDAWMVDKLQYQGFGNKIDAVFSQGGVMSGLALLLGGVFGAQLASVQLALPFGVGALFAVLVFVFAKYAMVETAKLPSKIFQLHEGVDRMKNVLRVSMKYGMRHSVVGWLIAATVLANLAFQPLNMYWAPHLMQFTHQQVWILGYVWAGISLALMLGAYLAKRYMQLKFSYVWLFVSVTLILAVPIFFISSTKTFLPLLIGFLIYEIGRGMLTPAHKSYLNQHIPSQQRATLLSFDSLMSKLGAAIGLMTLGWVAKEYSIGSAWFIASLLLLLLIPFYTYAVRRVKSF